MLEVCAGVADIVVWEPLVTGSPEYYRVHGEVGKVYGFATDYSCIVCIKSANAWAWQHGENPQLITSYEAMCDSCHFLYDMNDKWRKNLSLRQIGIKNHNVKLTEENVIEIRSLHMTGKYTQADLAYIFGVSDMAISNIIRRNVWKHI